MSVRDDLSAIFDRIANGEETEGDIQALRQLFRKGDRPDAVQLGKYNVNIGQGQDIHVGDRIYQGADAETIRKIIREELKAITDARYIPESHQVASSNYTANLDTEVIPLKSSPPTTSTFEFEVITVDDRGLVTKRFPKQAEYFVEFLGEAVELAMVSIPGGKFTMGSLQEESGSCEGERPRHIVTVKSFFMGRYPITQAQWRAIASLPKIKHNLNPDPSCFKGDNRPVERVNWYDAQEFCARLLQKTGRLYRLPSEAEWEYACRAHTNTPFHFGTTITTNLANYCGQEQSVNAVDRKQTTEVCSLPANTFGLCDLHGNVWEWCADYWHNDYQNAPLNGSAWLNNGNKEHRNAVVRGILCVICVVLHLVFPKIQLLLIKILVFGLFVVLRKIC